MASPQLPAVLSLALLAYQVGMIWFGGGVPTQDGPSHLYNAMVLRELLFHPGSAFHILYTWNSYPTSNWVSSVLIGVGNVLAGPSHAEQVLATTAILLLYGSMYYAQHALSPQHALLWPGLNALLNVWFLWMGFYSFYLGVALSVFCAGYYIRHLRHMARKHYVWLGAAMMILYFTHPMAQVLTGLVLSIVCFWDRLVSRPAEESVQGRQLGGRIRSALRSYVRLLASIAASTVVLVIFVRQEELAQTPLTFSWKELGSRLGFFPVSVFSITNNEVFLRVSNEVFFRISHVVCAWTLLAIFVSVVLWRRVEWRSTRGGLFAAVIVMFGIYLVTPEGSGYATFFSERVAWVILVFSILTVSTSVESRSVLRVFALFLAPLTGLNLYLADAAARSASRARAYYVPLEQMIRSGSSLLRLNYPANGFESRYELISLNYDPMLHAAESVALRRHCLIWSNYEAASKAFPVVFRLSEAEKEVSGLFETRDQQKKEGLQWFLARPETRIEYIVVYGELPEAGGNQDWDQRLADDFHDVLELLSREYDLVATFAEEPVLRLYRRKT